MNGQGHSEHNCTRAQKMMRDTLIDLKGENEQKTLHRPISRPVFVSAMHSSMSADNCSSSSSCSDNVWSESFKSWGMDMDIQNITAPGTEKWWGTPWWTWKRKASRKASCMDPFQDGLISPYFVSERHTCLQVMTIVVDMKSKVKVLKTRRRFNYTVNRYNESG